MVTLFLFGILLLIINMIVLAIKFTWKLLRAVLSIALLPLVLIGMFFGGLVKAAAILLVICIAVSFLGTIFADKRNG